MAAGDMSVVLNGGISVAGLSLSSSSVPKSSSNSPTDTSLIKYTKLSVLSNHSVNKSD